MQVGDGGGEEFLPEICSLVYFEASLGSIGTRTVSWGVEQVPDREGRLHVLQFADEVIAQNRMDQYVSFAEQCGEFTYDGTPSTFDALVLDDGEGVRAVSGAFILNDRNSESRMYWGRGSLGNVIVEFWQRFSGDSVLDAEAGAEMLRDRMDDASVRRVDALTVDPPAPDEEPAAADPAAAWNEWSIGCSGVGPIAIGSEIDDPIAAVPGASVAESGEGRPRVVTTADGRASIEVQPVDKGTTVAAVTVGDVALYGEAAVDGTVLPATNGVTAGDPVEDVIAAFPEGTRVRVISAGMYLYEAATRDGCVLQFHTDRDLVEAGATIIRITAEDATVRRMYGPLTA